MRKYALLSLDDGEWKVREMGSLEKVLWEARLLLATENTVQIVPFLA